MSYRPAVTDLILTTIILTLPATAQQKPFTQDQAQGMVRDGRGDESGAKAIEQRGIDFAPTEDFLQGLKAAGANEAFLKTLRAAKPPEPASAAKPLHQVQILALLAGEVPSHRVAILVNERGINFEVQQDYLDEVRLGGGDDELIAALKNAKVTKPVTVDPATEARQAEIRQHAARGAELEHKGQYAEAEREYRAALLLDSQNADIYVSLSHILDQQKKWDDAASAAREALRLNPNDEWAHSFLGIALGEKGDTDSAIAEFQEALRLNPKNENAHGLLGVALGNKSDWDGAIAEYREVLRLNPNNEAAHAALGDALGKKRDLDGAIEEYRAALRCDPAFYPAHYNLAYELEHLGRREEAVAEYRAALRFKPDLAAAKQHLAGLGVTAE